MDKKELIILTILLCSGCEKEKVVACNLKLDNQEIDINIKANYDEIYDIKVKNTFMLPYDVVLDEQKYNEILRQLDDSYYFIDNKLIKDTSIDIDDKYSLQQTIAYLNKEYFYCE